MPDIEEQLRRYGEAAERRALAIDRVVHELVPRRRRHYGVIAAAASIVVAAAAVLLTVVGDGDSEQVSVAGPSATATAPSTETTRVGPRLATIHGTATWTGGPDDRGDLRVGACPVDDETPSCPAMMSTDVGDDGSFTLGLPSDASREWAIAAYVTASSAGCVFSCEWRGAQVGPVTQVSVDEPTTVVELTVSARVVDVFVRDSRGNPFSGGGVQVTDLRCTEPDPACRGELAPMFMTASATDGSVRLVVEPSTAYELHGQATNTGWQDPAWTNDGSTFWFSPSLTVNGRDVRDGYVFLVDGAP